MKADSQALVVPDHTGPGLEPAHRPISVYPTIPHAARRLPDRQPHQGPETLRERWHIFGQDHVGDRTTDHLGRRLPAGGLNRGRDIGDDPVDPIGDDDVRGPVGQHSVAGLAHDDPGMRRFDLGDVLEHAVDSDRPAISVLLDHATRNDDPLIATGPDNSQLELIVLAGVDASLHGRPDDLAILGMIEIHRVLIARIEGFRRDAVDPVDFLGPRHLSGPQIQAPVADAGHLLGHAQHAQLLVDQPARGGLVEDVAGHPRHQFERVQHPVAGTRTRFRIQHREGADHPAVRRGYRCARIEPDPVRPGHHRMGVERSQRRGVLDHQQAILPHGRDDVRHALLARHRRH